MLINHNWILLVGTLLAAVFSTDGLRLSYIENGFIHPHDALITSCIALFFFFPFLVIWQGVRVSRIRGGGFFTYFKKPFLTSLSFSILELGLLFIAGKYPPDGDSAFGSLILFLILPPAVFISGVIISFGIGTINMIRKRYEDNNLPQ